jgi:ribosomal protein S12 methylthiotransferase
MSTQAPEIDGFCYVNDFVGEGPRRGEIRRMRITEAHDYDLIGALDAPTERALPLAPAANAFPILTAAR